MNYVLFADRNLDGFVCALITHCKSVYEGISDIRFISFDPADKLPEFGYNDAVTMLGVSLDPTTLDQMAYMKGVKVVVVNHQPQFVEDLGYSFVDWHNLPYFFIKEGTEYDIFSKDIYLFPKDQPGWRYYFSNNDVTKKTPNLLRSSSSIIRDVILKDNPGFESFLKTFIGPDYQKLVDLAQAIELEKSGEDEKSEAYLLHLWFIDWYEENKESFVCLKNDFRNELFLQLKSKFVITTLKEKIDQGRSLFHNEIKRTKEIALSDVKKVSFYDYGVRDINVCVTDSALNNTSLGYKLVKEHGWDVAIIKAPPNAATQSFYLYSNPDGADIDVLDVCKFYYSEGTGLNFSGERNFATIELIKGEEEMFFRPA